MHFQSNMTARNLRRRTHVSFSFNEIVSQMTAEGLERTMKFKIMALLDTI